MNEENKIYLPLEKSYFLIAGFLIIILIPMSTGLKFISGLLLAYFAFALFAFKEKDAFPAEIGKKAMIAHPVSSQVNPFLTSSAEMRVAMEHDIQTPLTKIIAQTDILMSVHPHLLDPLNNIQKNARYLSTHTMRYFEYFGLRETQLRLDHFTDLTEILRNSLIEYLDDFEDKGITYRFDIPDNPVHILTESNLLDRALEDVIHYLFAHCESFKDVRVTIIIRKVFVEVNIFIDTDQATREALSVWHLFGHTDTSRNFKKGLHHLSIVLANQMILKHEGLLTVNQYASKTLHYQIKLRNPHTLFE